MCWDDTLSDIRFSHQRAVWESPYKLFLPGKYPHTVVFKEERKRHGSTPESPPVNKKVKKTEESDDDSDDPEQAEICAKFIAFKTQMQKQKKEKLTVDIVKEKVPLKVVPSGWREPEHRLMVYSYEGAKGSTKVLS